LSTIEIELSAENLQMLWNLVEPEKADSAHTQENADHCMKLNGYGEIGPS